MSAPSDMFCKTIQGTTPYKEKLQRIGIGSILGRVRLGSILNKNNWNNASKRLFWGLFSFQNWIAPRSRIAGIYSYSGISQTNAP